MKKLIAAAVLMFALVGSGFAVDMHCTKPNKWTTVCKFSDGSVNKVSDFRDSSGNGDYYDDWYTAEQWADLEAYESQSQQQHQNEATAILCARGDFSKEYCDAYNEKNPLPQVVKPEYKSEASCTAGVLCGTMTAAIRVLNPQLLTRTHAYGFQRKLMVAKMARRPSSSKRERISRKVLV